MAHKVMTRKVLKKVDVQEETPKSSSRNKTQESDLFPRIKLTFEGTPQFFINKESKTITCKICSYINFPPELRILNNYALLKRVGVERPRTFTTTGIVRLHEGDKWNEELGKRLAECKAKRQAYAAGFNYANSIILDAIKDLRSVVKLHDSMKTLREHETEHFKELLDSVEA